ncbi:HET-domain-containing protein [Penicillium coprophilum]|uniref:HET-domain-containing protein n=1 Tax=Penicillium coprophilum TaxID=36646 RepID=UPI002388FABE|nr:HET-domain-containing protein [Penicillium coprophilum]KAJ5163094.1 HET-domain-containing protein [Penicillium coprophilum]
MSSAYPRIKWLVSSRNWPTVERRLDTAPQKVSLWLELNEKPVKEAVDSYIKYKVQQLTNEKEYNVDKINAVLHHLSSNAERTFLWVALVCKRLAALSQWDTEWLSTEFLPKLESFYMQMVQHTGDSQDAGFYKRILPVVSTVYRPTTLDELRPLASLSYDIPDKYLPSIIRTYGSFLTLRGCDIFFVDQTAKDFLLEKASVEIFQEGKEAMHRTIFWRSLQECETLKRDIYKLKSPGVSIDPDPLARAQYPCLYWVDHFKDSHVTDYALDEAQEGESVEYCLKHNFLCWIETISLLRGVSEGIAAMIKLDNIFQVSNGSYGLVVFFFQPLTDAIEDRQITGPCEASPRWLSIHSIPQASNRKQPPTGLLLTAHVQSNT